MTHAIPREDLAEKTSLPPLAAVSLVAHGVIYLVLSMIPPAHRNVAQVNPSSQVEFEAPPPDRKSVV